MTNQAFTADELNACDREPIHVPGSIQPHGLMLVASRDGLEVIQAAGDIEGRLGIADWHKRGLGALIGEKLASAVAAMTSEAAESGYIGSIETPTGETLDVSAHISGIHVLVELEPAPIEPLQAPAVLDKLANAAAGFERAGSLSALCERAAIEFRRLTGFDRVMVYRFLEDGAGRVLAEDKRSDLHSFLNQHFPASDIPRQARALYLRNLSRVIPDVLYRPAPLRPQQAGAIALDMSDSALRSVSPIHLQYLSNMGVRASASFSIVKDGALWGLVACHHESPRFIPYDARSACRTLAGALARQAKAKEEAEFYRQRIRLRSFEDDMVKLLSREGMLDNALHNHLDEIGRMMAGDGVAVLRQHELIRQGICPDDDQIRALGQWLAEREIEPVVATDKLSLSYPPAAEFQSSGSGLLAVVLSTAEPWILFWFRVEQVETVNWAGNPHKSLQDDPSAPLTPRSSFDAWSETVRGRARAWSIPEIDAAGRLRTALLEVQQNRHVRELNRQLTKILHDKDVLLKQKEFLIGEVNHRVQNSLQLVSSFLALQARASNDADLQTALEEARRRLSAVALVHRRLYRGDHVEVVDAARYIEELCIDTLAFMGPDWAQQITLNLAPVMIPTDRAVILGLVLTELMINTNKYAYGGGAGPIEIALIEDQGRMQMVIADKGVGKAVKRKGFGSRVIEGLLAQLGGEIGYGDNEPGLRVTVTAPIHAGEAKGPA